MSPAERAASTVADCQGHGVWVGACAECIAAAIEQTRREEREACARIAEPYRQNGATIAAFIRARDRERAP